MTPKNKKDTNTTTRTLLRIVEQVNSGMLTIDEDGDIKSISSAAAKEYGLKTKEIVGHSLSFLVSDIDQSKVLEEKEFKKERDKLQSYLDVALNLFVVLDTKGIVRSVNQRGLDIIGYNLNEVVGKNWIALVIPDDIQERIKFKFDNSIRKKKLVKEYHDTPVLTKTGELRMIHWHNSLIFHENGEIANTISSGVDVTELKNVEAKLRQLNQDLEKRVEERTAELKKAALKLYDSKQKMAMQIEEVKRTRIALMNSAKELTRSLEKEKELNNMKSRFVSMASHEFRTPLSTILSSAAIINKYTLTDQQEKRDRHIKKIKSSVTNLNGILNDFLSTSRLEEGKVDCHIEMIPIIDLCMETISQVDGLLKQGQEINFIGLAVEASFPLDRQIMKNCLINLLSNAIKYSQEEKEITLLIENDKSNLYIKVIDRGIGIPKEDQKHLFTRFFRADNVTNIKGTGLGLAIVKEYLTLLNGTISFKSKLGFGTTFEIKLPLNK